MCSVEEGLSFLLRSCRWENWSHCASVDVAVHSQAPQWHRHICCHTNQATWKQMEDLLHQGWGCEPECSLQVGPSCAWGQNLQSLVRTQCASCSLGKRGELPPGFDSCQAAQAPSCPLSWHCLLPMHFILDRPALMDPVLRRN